MLSEIKHSQKKTSTVWFHLSVVSRVVKFRNRKWNDDTERGEEEGNELFNGYRVSNFARQKTFWKSAA